MDNKKKITILLVVAALFYLAGLTPLITLGGDDALYVMLARSMAQGRGYVDAFGPHDLLHKSVPPGFSLALLPMVLVFGENIILLKLIPLLSTLAALFALYLLLREYAPQDWFWPLIIFGLNPMVVDRATILVSEPLFLFYSFLGLYFLIKYESISKDVNNYFWLSVLFMSLSFYTRSAGIVFLPTVFLYFLAQGKFKRSLLISGVLLLAIIPWFIFSLAAGSMYVGHFFGKSLSTVDAGRINLIDLILRLAHHAIIYTGKTVIDLFAYPIFYDISKFSHLFLFKVLCSLSICGVVAYGFVRERSNKRSVMVYYVFFTLLLCFVWPEIDPRFLLTILPFMGVYLFRGLRTLGSRNGGALAGSIFGLLIIANLIGNVGVASKKHFAPYSSEELSYLSALGWIKTNAPADSVIMCRQPRGSYFLTGRRALMYAGTHDLLAIIRQIRENNVRYVILDALGKATDDRFGLWESGKFLRPLLDKYPQMFILRFTTTQPYTYVYEVAEKNE